MKRSAETSERDRFDLDRDVPTTAADVAALRRLREQPASLEQVMAAVRAAGARTTVELRARGITTGEPFEL
jgi:hypothetical protein